MFRTLSKFLILTTLILSPALANPLVSIIATRVWPAADYTRITIEASSEISQKMLILKDPDRLVLDLEGVDLNANLKSLASAISPNDPYIKQIRVANFKPNVVRLVIDLKTQIKPNIFVLQPAGQYQHRLVLDVYPMQDPISTVIENLNKTAESPQAVETKPTVENKPQEEKTIESTQVVTEVKPAEGLSSEIPMVEKPIEKPIINKPAINKLGRLITIAIDAGHGGEDPGAQGANGSHEKDITLGIAKKLKERIDAEANMRGILTRDGDYFIPLHGRVVKALSLIHI